MNLQDLDKKLVAILGYGQEGKAVAAYLIKHGIKPVLFDQKPWGDWDEIEKLEIERLGVNFIFGPDAFKELAGFDVAFRSPGVNPKQVTSYKLQVTSQTKWFFEHSPAKIIGVTGTKGKGTTSALIYEILKENRSQVTSDKSQVYLTGNIGKVQPLEILDNLTAGDWVVYELSSFQLQDLDKSPHIGVVLMTTSEHLDYHSDEQEYMQAKSAITKFQTAYDFAVINADFKNSITIGAKGKGIKLYFSRQKSITAGCFVKNGIIVAPDGKTDIKIANIEELQLKGRHNLENICAAVAAARCAGASVYQIRLAIKNFKGLKHRLEFVAEKNGVKFYNDSFSTTPETAMAAIKSFNEPLIIILGGSSKNADFTKLGETIAEAKNIKAVILIGQEAVRIQSAITRTLTPGPSPKGRGKGFAILENAKNMAEIFEQIKSVAQPGDVVLLSPACASFGMFKNYKDRGEQFKQKVLSF